MAELVDRGRLRFAVFGPLRAWRDASELDLGPRQQRLALTLLLLRTGALVEVGELKQVIWDHKPPPTADNMVHRYMGSLRRLLEPGLTARANGRFLARETGGYRLALDGTAELDLLVFRARIKTARQLAEADRNSEALNLYLAGLSLWQGRCAAGMGAAAEDHPVFVAIDRECVEATREAARVALRCGRGAQLLPMLREAALRHPLDEALQAELLLALTADGKQAESIRLFGEVRRRLAEDLGVDPGPELRAAYESILLQDGVAMAPSASQVRVPPAQLPSDLRFFTGRGRVLREAVSLIRSEQPALPIVAFDGMPGVGKSTLAVHLAHQVVGDFPDGQLYADLHGFDERGCGAEPAEVLEGFLGALGVSPGAIPPSLDARATLFRSIVAGRRILLLLDNARDAEQVRPLLPGTAGNAVVVTSRRRLTGLAATHGAHLARLDVPPMEDARTAFMKRVGRQRASAEPAALDEIIEYCGRLPAALAVVAARAAAHVGRPLPGAHVGQPLSDLAAELRGTRRLDAMGDTHLDRDVRSVFSWSYRHLSEEAARAFRLLPLHPGPSITIDAAASLVGVPLSAARSHLTELAQTGLVDWDLLTGYRLHDLTRAYALELSADHESSVDQDTARQRLLQHYLHTAHGAVRLLRPCYEPFPAPQPMAGVTPQRLPDETAVLLWSAHERHALRAAVSDAAERGESTTAWQLALLMKDLFLRQGWGREAASLFDTVLDSARRAGDVIGMAQSHRGLGFLCHLLGDEKTAAQHLRLAVEVLAPYGESQGCSLATLSRGYIACLEGDHDGALKALCEALASFRAVGERPLEAIALASIAEVRLAVGGQPGRTARDVQRAG
ncbi:BTAD domain-containing putative transcriptional regulator [Streptomyces sp. NPDC048521]|uniref:AfsR/SARP family transcriptional regulator n=1 Tax=Streptomyces sp. NPDC048521 TaxID=3365566 RepID=UPI0037188E59